MSNEAQENVVAYTVQEFCVAYRISKPNFYRMVRNGKAPQSIKIGGTRRIPISAAKSWEEKHLSDTVISPEESESRRQRVRNG